jgi:DNA replication protein DnaC
MQPTGDIVRTIPTICTDCNQQFDAMVIEIGGERICVAKLCKDCSAVRYEAAKREVEEREKRELWEDFWDRVPPLFQDTAVKRLHADLQAVSLGWQYQAKGVGLVGVSGAGKTRAAVLIAERLWPELRSLCFLKATKLTRIAADKYSDDGTEKDAAKQAIKSAYRSKLLILDDIGKGRLTPTAEEILFDIIDERSERNLPIIWTSNANAAQLRALLSDDRAAALTRRLSEFSTVTVIK